MQDGSGELKTASIVLMFKFSLGLQRQQSTQIIRQMSFKVRLRPTIIVIILAVC